MKRIESDKLGAKSDKCLFVGYCKETKGYYFYNSMEQKVFLSRSATFLKKEFFIKESSGSKIELEKVQDQQMEADEPIEPTTAELADSVVDLPLEQALRRSTRVITEPERYGFLIDDDQNITLLENDKPESYDEVLKCSERDLWLKAMKSEMDSMSKNKVWTLSDAPERVKHNGFKSVFKKKIDKEGIVVTYKARLVAKGYRQHPGIDCDETF